MFWLSMLIGSLRYLLLHAIGQIGSDGNLSGYFPFTTGTKAFLRKLTGMGDVWIVTVSQGIEWIKSPTILDKIEDFEPWKCDSPPPPDCPNGECKVCLYYLPPVEGVMPTCTPACPPHYPWVGNPDGN